MAQLPRTLRPRIYLQKRIIFLKINQLFFQDVKSHRTMRTKTSVILPQEQKRIADNNSKIEVIRSTKLGQSYCLDKKDVIKPINYLFMEKKPKSNKNENLRNPTNTNKKHLSNKKHFFSKNKHERSNSLNQSAFSQSIGFGDSILKTFQVKIIAAL